jgi:hypothetical protein
VIVAAALLVLLGLGLFVGGILTGETVLYWSCVVACVAAGAFLVLARVRMGHSPTAGAGTGVPSAGATAAAERSDSAPRTDVMPAQPPREAAPVADAGTAAPGDAPPGAASPGATPGPFPHDPAERPSTAAHAMRGTSGTAAGEPPLEEVEVTDLLLVFELRDEVLVVDEHPRYHLAGCRWLAGRETIPLPLDEARAEGFTPCGRCQPDRTLAERERGRRAGRRAP